MSCAIVSGYALDCKDTVGGVKAVYITELANITAVSQNASGFVTGITMAATKKFYKYNLLAKGANTFVDNVQSDPANGTVAYEPTLSVVFSKMQQDTTYKLDLIAKNRTAVIVETKDGSFFLAGKENGMEINGGGSATGQAMNDFQGYTLQLVGMEKSLSPEVSSSIIAALL